MGKKPVTNKRNIMRLASAAEEALAESDNISPVLDRSETTLFDELCNATREGDLERVAYIISVGGPVNAVDRWQCSPLYWACLCGHYDVTKYLLENGAKCDRNTFQGERCIYGALTSQIRNLLLSYKLTKATDETQPFQKFLTELYEDPQESDIKFKIRIAAEDSVGTIYREYPVHRFVIAARSNYFRRNLMERWLNETEVKLQRQLVDPESFDAVLHYLYTGQLGDLNRDSISNLMFVCQHLELPALKEKCEKEISENRNASHGDTKDIVQIRSDFEKFVKTNIFGATGRIIDQDGDGTDIRSVTVILEGSISDVEPIDPQTVHADICILIEDLAFPCHKALLTLRSEYFDIMFSGRFSESYIGESQVHYPSLTLNMPILRISDVSPEAFAIILEFIYTDVAAIPIEMAFEILIAADRFLFHRLKSIAAIIITSQKTPIMDVYELIRTAIDLGVDRIEQYCTKYLAEHLDDHIGDEEFKSLIKESAESIAEREETDTIPFIDELRYFLGKKYSVPTADLDASGRVHVFVKETLTAMEAEYNHKLDMLDEILDGLGLEA
ncbi:BTB/POZ protein [Umbelopsis sp. PMI_123]|nr:BTB/POZ protein [Umbelopsis sp. PMI_123]